MTDPARRDRPIYFLVYLAAGAAMGGFLDVAVFRLPTPIYGMLTGAAIAVLFQIGIWIQHRRRR
jgi:hypothetical protein